MLNSYCAVRTDDTCVADANTAADSRTSTGRPLRVSFGRAPPPASSFVYYDFPDSAPCENDDEWRIDVVAAHGDSVLLEMRHRHSRSGSEDNHFLYRAGAARARPPSLDLLPARDFLTKSEQVLAPYIHPPIRPSLHSGNTGLLRRGDDDALLVQLQLMYDRTLRQEMAEFSVLRVGTSQWELMEPVPIVDDEDDKAGELLQLSWCTNTAIPVGDRFLCFVGYKSGFFLCDMADEASPKVRYVRMPPVSRCSDDDDDDDDRSPMKFSQNMGAAGDNAVRFVSIDPHCCCGGPGRSTCARSRYAFTINTWTMNLSMDEPLAWVKDGEIDCEELWALSGYEGLPRTNLQCPLVSLDNPNVVCFLVSNYDLVSYKDYKVWMIQLDIKTKTLLSVVQQFTNDPWRAYYHLPAKLQW
ncbi:hypothetical protein BAE44_0022383 [Dichanthelium oligosanthes]|uniref:DUF1618 domain-containing protein n=1 Tax=Dichanthelium oligosanthes TaxID=888268 RepID=A0A1E5UUV6_9POAL|nr:hypothetical protein BAE44_0022383 [Dichanthelium oligosanthes]